MEKNKSGFKNFHEGHGLYFKKDFLREELSKTGDFQTVADIFALLSDTSRLKIFWLLCHSKECVNNISEIMGMTMPAVSHHLKILRDQGLISGERDGKEIIYAACSGERAKSLHLIIESLMSLTCPDFDSDHEHINKNGRYMDFQIAKIKDVHDYLIENLSRHITIEELSKKFAMNSTTLKSIFKDVYGKALATHIKEHRMEKAAELLTKTELSIKEISLETGYESQSKFCAAFKDFFGKTPSDYRK